MNTDAILEFVDDNPGCTCKQITKSLKLVKKDVNKFLYDKQKDNITKSKIVENEAAPHWYIVEPLADELDQFIGPDFSKLSIEEVQEKLSVLEGMIKTLSAFVDDHEPESDDPDKTESGSESLPPIVSVTEKTKSLSDSGEVDDEASGAWQIKKQDE